MFYRKVLRDFFRKKKNPKNATKWANSINTRLAEVYQQLSNIQDLGNLVMYNPEVDTNIKCVFLAWYQMRLVVLKEELDQITILLCESKFFWVFL